MKNGENKPIESFFKELDDALKKKGFCAITLKKKYKSSGIELFFKGKTFEPVSYLLHPEKDDVFRVKEFLKCKEKDKNHNYSIVDLDNSKTCSGENGNYILKDYIVHDSNTCEVDEIENIVDIINYVQSQENLLKEYGYNLYFRGQKAHYDLLPSLFRNKGWVVHEAELNALIINDNPKEFLDCKSTFEKLVKLKHYNQPSRLLDITSNPLIALYFACDGDAEDDIPVVITAYSDKSKEKQSVSSDTVLMLTGLANSAIQSDLIQEVIVSKDTFPFCRDKEKNMCWGKKDCNIQPEMVVPKRSETSCYFAKDRKVKKHKKNDEKPVGEIFIGEIIHQCKKESGSELYWDDLCFNELNQCILVNPPLNTDRIVRQKGCFIMCGLNPCDMFSPPETFYSFFEFDEKKVNINEKEEKDLKRHIYYVHPKNILSIQSQLKMIGIDKYYVFPELENDIEERKSIYENL